MLDLIIAWTLATTPLNVPVHKLAIREEEIYQINAGAVVKFVGVPKYQTPCKRPQTYQGRRFCNCSGAGNSRGNQVYPV